MFIFSKIFDQLIRATFLKINPIIDSSRDLAGEKLSSLDSSRDLLERNYLPDNIVTTAFVFLKTFFSTGRKCVKYFALGLTLKSDTGNESYKVNTTN